uniref:Right handed beta helix domain-containing protein n=1 Tax=Hanusia phi TaxID=3032 RepID=A0A7S0HCQ2_9CRYP
MEASPFFKISKVPNCTSVGKEIGSLIFKSHGDCQMKGRWWLKPGIAGSFEDMNFEHESHHSEPCPHTDPISCKKDVAIEPWLSNSSGIAIAGVCELRDEDCPFITRQHPIISFDPMKMTNDEGMTFTTAGRWEGMHSGGKWEANVWNPNFPEFRLEQSTMNKLKYLYTKPFVHIPVIHQYLPCEFCNDREKNVFNIMGGPWNFTRCQVRGAKIVLVRLTYMKAKVSLHDCLIAGLQNILDADTEKQAGLFGHQKGRGNSKSQSNVAPVGFLNFMKSDLRAHFAFSASTKGCKLTITSCLIENCGWGGGGGIILRGASCRLKDSTLKTCSRAIGLLDGSNARIHSCFLVKNRICTFFTKKVGHISTLDITNSTIEGPIANQDETSHLRIVQSGISLT